MAVELVVLPGAEVDIGEAFDWYEHRRRGLGEEFLSCVDACINRICRMPTCHVKVYEDYRLGAVRRFPYVVFYEYDGETVTVYSVFHTSRDPDKWRERLP